MQNKENLILMKKPTVRNCVNKDTLSVLRRFRALRVENYELTQTWCIEPESEKPVIYEVRQLDINKSECVISRAPGVAFKVDGLSFQGGIIILRGADGGYVIVMTNFTTHAVSNLPAVQEQELIPTLDLAINGLTSREARIAHLGTKDPEMARAILSGKKVCIL